MLKKISSKDNQEFKFFKKIATQKIKNFYFLEGEHLILAFMEKFGESAIKYLLFAENQQSEIISQISKKNFANLVEIRADLLKTLSNLKTPSKIAAIVEIINDKQQINLHCDSVILDEIQDPGNIGTILRTAIAAGFSQILLSANCAKVYTPKVLRATQGAIFELNIFENLNDDDLLNFVENFDGNTLSTALLENFAAQNNLFLADFANNSHNFHEKSKNFFDTLPKLAWIFGSEGRGVRKFLQDNSKYKIFIPMAVKNKCVESLNVATAAAICLFESVRRRNFCL